MLTKVCNGSRVIDPEITILDSDDFKYAYLTSFFDEVGVNIGEDIEPLKGTDSWVLEGELHGLPVHASFNTFESLSLGVNSKRVPYKGNMRETLNTFMSAYREEWFDYNQDFEQGTGYL